MASILLEDEPDRCFLFSEEPELFFFLVLDDEQAVFAELASSAVPPSLIGTIYCIILDLVCFKESEAVHTRRRVSSMIFGDFRLMVGSLFDVLRKLSLEDSELALMAASLDFLRGESDFNRFVFFFDLVETLSTADSNNTLSFSIMQDSICDSSGVWLSTWLMAVVSASEYTPSFSFGFSFFFWSS